MCRALTEMLLLLRGFGTPGSQLNLANRGVGLVKLENGTPGNAIIYDVDGHPQDLPIPAGGVRADLTDVLPTYARSETQPTAAAGTLADDALGIEDYTPATGWSLTPVAGTAPLWVKIDRVNYSTGTVTQLGVYHIENLPIRTYTESQTIRLGYFAYDEPYFYYTETTDDGTGERPINNPNFLKIESLALSHEKVDYDDINVEIVLPNSQIGSVNWHVDISGGTPIPADYDALLRASADGRSVQMRGILNEFVLPELLSTAPTVHRTVRVRNYTNSTVTFPNGDIVIEARDTNGNWQIWGTSDGELVVTANAALAFQFVSNAALTVTVPQNDSIEFQIRSLTNLLNSDVVIWGGDTHASGNENFTIDGLASIETELGHAFEMTSRGVLRLIDRQNGDTVHDVLDQHGFLGDYKALIEADKFLEFNEEEGTIVNEGTFRRYSDKIWKTKVANVDPLDGAPDINTNDWEIVDIAEGISNNRSSFLFRHGALTFNRDNWDDLGRIEYYEDNSGTITTDTDTKIFSVVKGFISRFVFDFDSINNRQNNIIITNETVNQLFVTALALQYRRANPGEDLADQAWIALIEDSSIHSIPNHSQAEVTLDRDTNVVLEDLEVGTRIEVRFTMTPNELGSDREILGNGYILNFFVDGRGQDVFRFYVDTDGSLVRRNERANTTRTVFTPSGHMPPATLADIATPATTLDTTCWVSQ